MKYLSISFSIVFFSICTFATNEAALILKANKAYASGSFSEAAETYNLVVQAGYESPELFYNLGNSYFKMHDYASSILWYERAKRLEPGNEDINFNLNVANTKISDKIEPLPELFYKRWAISLVLIFPVDTWAILAVIFLFAGLLAFLLFMVSRVLVLRKAGFWAGSGMIVFALFFLFIAWRGDKLLRDANEAIVFAPTITVKSSPDNRSTELFVIHEGTKVQLLDNISGWYEIRIANGSIGWLEVSSVVKI